MTINELRDRLNEFIALGFGGETIWVAESMGDYARQTAAVTFKGVTVQALYETGQSRTGWAIEKQESSPRYDGPSAIVLGPWEEDMSPLTETRPTGPRYD